MGMTLSLWIFPHVGFPVGFLWVFVVFLKTMFKELNLYISDCDSSNNMYTVEIQSNETAIRLNLNGNYTLQLHDIGFQLLEKGTEKVLYSWPVTVLRRYGTSYNIFSFECGRRSQTGVGNFVFITPYHKLIKQAVDEMGSRAKLLSSTNLQKSVDSLQSRNTDTPVQIEDTEPLLTSSTRNEIFPHFSREGVKEDLGERRDQNERVDYSVLDRGECRYPRNLHNSKVVKELLRERQKPNEARNQDNSKNLKIENDIYGG